MRTLKESILSDIDSQLDHGNIAVDNLDTLPTVKDFEKHSFNNKWQAVTWYCPNVLDMYRSKYSYLIPKDADSITVIIDAIDALTRNIMECNIYITTGKGSKGTAKLKQNVFGWEDKFVGVNLRVCKKMAISILNGLAHNHDKLEEVFKYSTEYTEGIKNSDDDYRVREKKFPVKSLLKLIEK